MIQIPTRLLPLTVEVQAPDDDAQGQGAYLAPVAVGHVRLDRSEGLTNSDAVMTDGTAGTLYIDAVNSEGAFDIPTGSRVRLEGETRWHGVGQVRRFETFDGAVHHWEVTLL